MRLTPSLAGAAAIAACAALAGPLAAQSSKDRSKDAPKASENGSDTQTFSRLRSQLDRMTGEAADRPVLGIATTSSGDRDTLGLLVVSVTPGGPADKAGIEEGDRLAAVNGVNLRLAAADAGERDMNGLTTRRLVREIAKLKPGADAELRVWTGGAFKTVRVKTVAADELPGRTVRFTSNDADARGVVGMELGGGGSRRDTLGVLVVRVESDGPAEKAGIVEGDRIAAVNGADLRVAREDAGDGWMSSAKSTRFRRALRDVKPGDKVTFRVYSGGQSKSVVVTAAKASDVYKTQSGRFYIGSGDGWEGPMMAPMPPMPAMPPMPPAPPRGRVFQSDGDGAFEFNFDGNAVRGMSDAIRMQVDRAVEQAAVQAARAADAVGRVRIITVPQERIISAPGERIIAAPRVTIVRRATTTI